MADQFTPTGLLQTSSLDPVMLHMRALNSLARCKANLLGAQPLAYLQAQRDLRVAQQAIETLGQLQAFKASPEFLAQSSDSHGLAGGMACPV